MIKDPVKTSLNVDGNFKRSEKREESQEISSVSFDLDIDGKIPNEVLAIYADQSNSEKVSVDEKSKNENNEKNIQLNCTGELIYKKDVKTEDISVSFKFTLDCVTPVELIDIQKSKKFVESLKSMENKEKFEGLMRQFFV